MLRNKLVKHSWLAIVPFLSGLALAQESASNYPSRVVTIIIPNAPGGSIDKDVRLYAQKLTESLGKPFVMDFKTGAGGSIGTTYVGKAPADGYTLLGMTSNFSVNPALYAKLPYDPIRDFAPVSQMYTRGSILVVHPNFPANSWSEYLAYVKANPGKVNFGTSGAGGVYHIGGAWLHSEINAKVTFIHYKGAGPLLTDLMAGTVDTFPPSPFMSLGLIKGGKLKPIAMLSAERSSFFPDLRTVAEQSLPGFDFFTWGGIITTGGTPPAIVNKLSGELAKVAKSPDVLKIAASDGTTMVGSTPEAFRNLIASEIVRWKKVVRDNNIKVEE